MKTAIINGKICTPMGIKDHAELIIDNEKIISIETAKNSIPDLFDNSMNRKKKGKKGKIKADKTMDAKGSFIIPGFFDTHCHAARFFDSCDGRYDPKKNSFTHAETDIKKGIPEILKAHSEHGTTSMIMSCFANEEKQIEWFIKYGGQYTRNNPKKTAKLKGLDMEGNYIKESAFAGAQNPKYFLKPDPAYFDKLMKLSGGAVKRVLVAPEWGDSAFKFIKHLVKNGVVAGVGHSGASYDEMIKAYEAGIRVIVHCGNGPMSQNFKTGGVLDALFYLRDKVTAELICDLHHVHPRWITAFLRNFNYNVVGVTDASFVTVAPVKVDEFVMAGLTGYEKDGVVWVKDKPNTLFGSCLTADRAFENFLNIFMRNQWGYFVGNLFSKPIELNEAVTRVSKIMSANPAELYGIKDIGTIEPGKAADILIMDIKRSGAEYKCNIKDIIIDGIKIN